MQKHMLFVEDDAIIRANYTDLLTDEGFAVAAFADRQTAMEYAQETMPDLALLDIHLPGLSGVELAAMLSERFPDMRKIMLTSLHSDEIVFQALKAGAVAYVLKSGMEDIQEVIRIVLNGGAVITPTVALRVMRHFQRDRNSVQALSQLTTREKQILEELSSGEAPRDISGTLQLSIHTVRQHIKNIYAKLQVSSRSELTRRLKELGIE